MDDYQSALPIELENTFILLLIPFLQEIASMDADTTSAPDDGSGNRQPEEAVSSTTEDNHPVVSAADGYEVEGDYYGNEGTCTTSLED